MSLSDVFNRSSAIPCGVLITLLGFRTSLPAQPTDELIRSPNEQVSAPLLEGTSRINKELRRHWDAADIDAARECRPETLVRRLYLDLAGRIPTVSERAEFLRDDAPDRTEKLVDVLLDSEDHFQHFADIFDTLLMGRTSSKKYEQRESSRWHAYLESVFRENKPWNQVTRDILLARPDDPVDKGVIWFLYERNNKPQEIAEAIAPAFFGIRIECAQCHDHMMAHEIEQAHYWGLVAFYNRSRNEKSGIGPAVGESAVGGFSDFASLDGSSYPNLLTFFQAPTVSEPRPEADAKEEDFDKLYVTGRSADGLNVPLFSRRQKFVDEVVKDHPLIARAFVNRVWAMLMGRGLVHPFDEMDSQHPPSHPDLLNWLAEDFRRSRYDIRRLVRMVVNNKAYRLESRRPSGVEDPSSFAWYLERPLTAEQLARSIDVAIHGEPRNDARLTSTIVDRLPQVMPDEIVSSVNDALFLSNNSVLHDYLNSCDDSTSLIARVMQQQTAEGQAEVMIGAVFGRSVQQKEIDFLADFLRSRPNQSPSLHRIRLAIWSLLTSAEFQINH